MPVMKRFGSAIALGRVSRRVNVTLPAAAFAFLEMKTRPVWVAAHNVPVSLAVRASAARKPPARVPSAAAVREVAPAGPMRTKSPQAGFANDGVNSGQVASRYARLPPPSLGRQAP